MSAVIAFRSFRAKGIKCKVTSFGLIAMWGGYKKNGIQKAVVIYRKSSQVLPLPF